MEEQFVIAIISCAATVFSAYIGWKSFRGKNSSHNGKNLISEYAEMLDGGSESQRSFAINEIHAFAIKKRSIEPLFAISYAHISNESMHLKCHLFQVKQVIYQRSRKF